MRILYKSVHNIDLNGNEPVRKDISGDFENYLYEYIDFSINGNNTKRDYTISDTNTTVIHCVSAILRRAIEQMEPTDEYADSITKKLISVEKKVQKEIIHMGVHVQKGSIIQALIEDEGSYKYIIAKVEHLEFIEAESFRRDLGFSSENKRVWKSAVIPLEYANGEIVFGIIKCYAKSGEKYWTELFLEVEPAKTDEVNTFNLYNEVNRVLSRLIKKHSLADYTLLQNSLLTKLQSRQLIEYPVLIEDLFAYYQPIDEKLDMEKVRTELSSLHQTGKFDTQFYSAPNVINRKKRRKYTLTPSIELVVKEGLDDLNRCIKAVCGRDGERYLQVTCEELSTFNSFRQEIPVQIQVSND